MLAATTTITATPTPTGQPGEPSRRSSRITGTAAAIKSSARTMAAVVARPGSRNSNGATTTSAANPVTADIHGGRRAASRMRIARP